ncbi:MAG: hypothetical protein AB7P03_07300 [Kofleriaceae bacterium]
MRPLSLPSQMYSLRQAERLSAHRALARMFARSGARRATVRLHEGRFESFYLAPQDIWLVAHRLPNRFRNAFGPGDPVGRRNLWPSIQFNLAITPGSARPRARFLRDDGDRVWLAHSGTLGGRQTGLSRRGFLHVLGGAREVTVDGSAEQLVLLGTFARPTLLLEQLAAITHAAAEYRAALAAGLREPRRTRRPQGCIV